MSITKRAVITPEQQWAISRARTVAMLQNEKTLKYDGGKDWLGCSKGSAQMNYMLLKGTTIQEVINRTSRKKSSSFHSHKTTLQTKHGLRITRTGKVYRF